MVQLQTEHSRVASVLGEQVQQVLQAPGAKMAWPVMVAWTHAAKTRRLKRATSDLNH
ncbi:hypothetical protein MAPG_08082 [Magnaporthiopsis poae ATCC 64411]|uniref:Uncharacterized protein n=1 Tax=Magnaporthiopsis poae (strain ATCC 64411 / 73-15) TaxID=644358 RepID=A0A0C4E6E8_MAGP6|nr:hypothetical protein MAPG_08082 [Magnaporthiopsis poae ATCC 64411]